MICFLISAAWCWLMPSKTVRQRKSSFSKPIGKAPKPMAKSQIFTSFSSWSVFSGNSLRHVGNQPRHPIFFLEIVLKNPLKLFHQCIPIPVGKKREETGISTIRYISKLQNLSRQPIYIPLLLNLFCSFVTKEKQIILCKLLIFKTYWQN